MRITAPRTFSPCSGCTAMVSAVGSPFTVTGSLGIFTRFPFHLTFIRHLKGYLVVLLTSFYDICPAFVNREGKYQIDRLSADGYGKIYCNWRRDVLYCMAQVLDRHCCPLKRETGVNPVRTRHCDRGIQGQDATERSGRRPCVRIRKPGALPVLLAKEILRATSNWSYVYHNGVSASFYPHALLPGGRFCFRETGTEKWGTDGKPSQTRRDKK